MTAVARRNGAFRRAVLVSAVIHVALFVLIAVSPSLPLSSRKGLVSYIPLSLGGLPGGGGSGGGNSRVTAPAPAPAPPEAKKPSLRDLTVPQKALPETPQSKLRYPSEKPKREPKSKKAKQAVLPEPSPEAKTGQSGTIGSQGTGGSGVRIGLGGPGEGSGSGYDSQIGLSTFPYTYYLQAVTDRISSNWFTSLVDPGVKGNFQTVVYFKIQRNGQTTDITVKESSGVESLDLSAMRAVQRSTPFPPLPTDYNQDYLGIFLIFEHSK
jgi:TonB family protein